MNTLDLLKNDHKRVIGILEKLAATTERAIKTRQKLFGQLKAELDLYSQIEDTALYPALQEKEKTQAVTLKIYETQQVIKTLLNELATLPVDSKAWTAKLATLRQTLAAHIDAEENEQFESVRRVPTKEEIAELGKRTEAEKSGKPRDSVQNASDVGAQGMRSGRETETETTEPLPGAPGVSASRCSPCSALVPNLLLCLSGKF